MHQTAGLRICNPSYSTVPGTCTEVQHPKFTEMKNKLCACRRADCYYRGTYLPVLLVQLNLAQQCSSKQVVVTKKEF